jgi:hypothetical protein
MWYVLHHPQHQFSRPGTHWRDRRSEATDIRSQRRQGYAHRQIQTVAIGLVLRLPGQVQGLEFEKYLKSHSGRAFAKKRLR